MSIADFPTRKCAHCKAIKVICLEFSPKGKNCRECERAYKQSKRKEQRWARKRGWETFSLFQKRPFEWEGM